MAFQKNVVITVLCIILTFLNISLFNYKILQILELEEDLTIEKNDNYHSAISQICPVLYCILNVHGPRHLGTLYDEKIAKFFKLKEARIFVYDKLLEKELSINLCNLHQLQSFYESSPYMFDYSACLKHIHVNIVANIQVENPSNKVLVKPSHQTGFSLIWKVSSDYNCQYEKNKYVMDMILSFKSILQSQEFNNALGAAVYSWSLLSVSWMSTLPTSKLLNIESNNVFLKRNKRFVLLSPGLYPNNPFGIFTPKSDLFLSVPEPNKVNSEPFSTFLSNGSSYTYTDTSFTQSIQSKDEIQTTYNTSTMSTIQGYGINSGTSSGSGDVTSGSGQIFVSLHPQKIFTVSNPPYTNALMHLNTVKQQLFVSQPELYVPHTIFGLFDLTKSDTSFHSYTLPSNTNKDNVNSFEIFQPDFKTNQLSYNQMLSHPTSHDLLTTTNIIMKQGPVESNHINSTTGRASQNSEFHSRDTTQHTIDSNNAETKKIHIIAKVGKLFAIEIPKHWLYYLASKKGTVQTNGSVTVLEYNSTSSLWFGLCHGRSPKAVNGTIAIISTSNVAWPAKLQLYIQLVPNKMLSNPPYVVEVNGTTSLDKYFICNKENFESFLTIQFLLKLCMFLPHVNPTDLTLVHSYFPCSNLNFNTSINERFSVQWIVDKINYRIFKTHYYKLFEDLHHLGSKQEFLFSMLPEFIAENVNVFEIYQIKDTKKEQQTISLAVALPICLIVAFMFCSSLVFITRYRKRKHIMESFLSDKTLNKCRKPVRLMDECEMDYFNPSKPKILNCDYEYAETSVQQGANNKSKDPVNHRSTQDISITDNCSIQGTPVEYSFVHANFQSECDDNSLSGGLSLSFTDVDDFAKKGN